MFILACSSEDDPSNMDHQEISIIGKWHVSDVKAYDENMQEVGLPDYINVDCESQTEYTFYEDGTFLEGNDMYWDNHIDGTYNCYVDNEGDGFDSGEWNLSENMVLDLDWVYKNDAIDGMIWSIEFIDANTFKVFHDKNRDEPPYSPDYYYFYSRVE